MPARRHRARAQLWTHKKKQSAGTSHAPLIDDAGWDALEHAQVGVFVVDTNGWEQTFQLNDVAAIRPPGTEDDSEEYWIARIKGIRVAPSGQVYVQVNWYYSPQDVSEKMPSFDAAHCATRERIYSHHSEVIPALMFEAPIPMIHFLDDDPEQKPIRHDQFFCRYFFDTNVDRPEFNVFPYTCAGDGAPSPTPRMRSEESKYRANTCICGEPYRPDDEDPSHVMHWCPRPLCRRAYHRVCLLESGHHSLLAARDVVCARLGSSPDAEAPVDATAVVHLLPAGLASLAAQPMVRGGVHGVAGNVAAVVCARRVVYASFPIQDSTDCFFNAMTGLARWGEEAGFESWKEAVVEPNLCLLGNGEEGVTVVLLCPECGGAV
ncbi:hypothetical protein FB451DRAFT_1364917 [Mycena latifolia]|nr:hypothetical protein FB451DRAFT_1364917 [Mycena latifolia]